MLALPPPPESWRPRLGEVLDPPLYYILKRKMTDYFETSLDLLNVRYSES